MDILRYVQENPDRATRAVLLGVAGVLVWRAADALTPEPTQPYIVNDRQVQSSTTGDLAVLLDEPLALYPDRALTGESAGPIAAGSIITVDCIIPGAESFTLQIDSPLGRGFVDGFSPTGEPALPAETAQNIKSTVNEC
jgi:hypothetical protein